ncbi:MAG: UDP-3-O-acyl-N-acetylglucosamine deacetylase [Cyanobacteriota bacterium]|nr:UDP-3-O-acyl-N-acetylglucosamine deacetylase [Cyanobacteriota bacterium]
MITTTSGWPADYSRSWTLAGESECSGVGLHSGAEARVRLQPSPLPGYWVGRLDQPQQPLQRLEPSLVADTRLCTALRLNQGRLATVEHLLSALAGTGITQAQILVDGDEIPLLDGSALPWVEAIATAGLQAVDSASVRPVVEQTLLLQEGTGFITAMPADELWVGAAIEFPQQAIGRQLFTIRLSPELYVNDIAPARTFGFRDQVEQLRSAGLIQGGALENALVCDGAEWMNPPLRFVDEPVRHKLLDLLGDLALAGLPRAQVFAFRGSHGLHTKLAASLVDRPPSHQANTPQP